MLYTEKISFLGGRGAGNRWDKYKKVKREGIKKMSERAKLYRDGYRKERECSLSAG